MSASFSLIEEEFLGLIRFPLWWYGAGLRGVWLWVKDDLALEWGRLGIRLWMRSWLQPMYGAYDVVGRLISVVMRTVVIIVRCIWWVTRALIYMVGVVAWCVWPLLALVLLCLPFVW